MKKGGPQCSPPVADADAAKRRQKLNFVDKLKVRGVDGCALNRLLPPA